MQINRLASAILATCVVCLAACQRDSAQAPADQAAPAEMARAVAPEPVKAVTSGPLSVAPGRLESCDIGAVVTVKWDVRTEHPGVTETEVWTGPTTEKLTLFAASTAIGEARTGPWAGPGSIFVLRDRANNNELARVSVDGPACN